MKLFASHGWRGKEELKSEAPTESQIIEIIEVRDWKDFDSIRLEVDSENWLEVSGNICDDGLAIMYAEYGVHYISDDAPESLHILKDTLRLYLKGDKRFKNIGFTSEFEEHPLETSQVSEIDYQNWKTKFDADQQEDKRRKGIKKVILLFVAIAMVLGIIKLIEYAYYYEYQFFGHETVLVIADVAEVEWMYFQGEAIQRVIYFFQVDGRRQKGYFLGAHANVSHVVGDKVQVKYAVDDPSISEIVGFVKIKVSND